MRIRTSVLVAVLSLGMSAGLTTGPAFGQTAQPTAQELYESGMELYQAGQLEEAQKVFRDVDPLQLPRELRPVYYNTIVEIDQKLKGGDPAPQPAQPEAQPQAPAQPQAAPADAGQLIAQADVMAQSRPADAIALYQEALAAESATAEQKATAQARVAGLERRLNSDVTQARRLIALAEQDLVAGDIDAAQAKLTSVRNSGVELGFFDSESVNKKLALIDEVKASRAAAAQPQQPAADDDEAQARAAAAEAQLAAMQRQIAENQEPQEQVGRGAPVGDLIIQARVQTAGEKAEQGDRALRNGQLSAAVQLFEEASLLDPDNTEYKQKLAQAREQLNAQVRPLDLINRTGAERAVDYQRAIAEYEQAMAAANAALENKDFLSATDSAIQARTVLSTNRAVIPQNEYNELTSRAARLQAEINETQARARAIEEADAERIRSEKERDAVRIAIQRKAEEVQARIRSARALQMEQNYGEALAEIEAALFIDPANPALQGYRDMLQDLSLATESHRLMRHRDLQVTNLSLMNIEASTPYTDILTYPGEWPELTATRLRGLDNDAEESESNRAAQQQMRRVVASAPFDNSSLGDVINFIRDTTGANIAVNWPALELVGIDQDSLVTINLSRIPAEQLLRLVLDQVSADAFDDDKAGFTIDEGVVKISTLRDLKSVTETRVYDIRDLLVQVPNFTQAPAFDLNESLSNTNSGGSNGGGGGGGGSGGGGGLFGDNDQNNQEEDVPSREELVDQLTELIQTTVGDPDEWLDEESTLTELNGNMIIKTTSDNHRQIMGLLGRLRETRAIQISVEARFLTVDKNFLEEFNVDFDISFNNNNLDVVRNDNPGVDLVNNQDGSDGPDGEPDVRPDGRPDDGASTLPITIGQDGSLARRRATSVGSPFTAENALTNAMSIGYSFINDVAVDLIVDATQANHNAISLTAPRVTFFNGQRAYVLVADQIAFVSDLEPIPDSVGFDPTLSVITTGVILDVEGTISSDRRYVTMTLRPSLATLIDIADFEIGGGLATINADGEIVPAAPGVVQVPEIQITQVRNTVSVPDRGTLLIGGQRLVGETEVEVGVPILSKIPVVSRLFTNTSTVQDERTLLILVRPTIIIQSEQEDLLFPGLNQDPEGYNVGAFGP